MAICGECGYPVIGKIGSATYCPYCGIRGTIMLKIPARTSLLIIGAMVLGTVLVLRRR